VIVRLPSIVTTTITSPTSADTYDAGQVSSVDVAGTGASALSVTGCAWSNSLGGSGSVTNIGSGQPLPWTATVPLTVGTNVITFTCTNAGQTTGLDVITIVRTQIAYVEGGSVACADVPTGGSEAAPWCTIQYAVDHVTARSTIKVKSGTYAETVVVPVAASGDASADTVLEPFETDMVTIDGPGIGSSRVRILASYFTFRGITVRDFNQGIFIDAAAHVTISGVTVEDVGQEGIHVRQNSSFITISGSTVQRTGLNGSNGEGFYIGTGSAGPLDNSHDITLSNNTILDTTHEGIELKAGTYNVTIDGNTLTGTNTAAAVGTSVGAIEVLESNGGVQTLAFDPQHVIRNNVISSVKTGIRLGTGSTAYNNVIHTVTTGSGILINNSASDAYTRRVYHNTIDMASGAVTISAGTTDVRNNIGPTTSGNLAFSAAYFTDAVAHDYTLVFGAAPIDMGADLTVTVPLDAAGSARSGLPDLGAYEFIGDDPGGDDEVPASSCNAGDINLAIGMATDGQTVVVPSGECELTTSVSVPKSKGITIQGAGIGSTIITDSVSGTGAIVLNVANGNALSRVTAMTIIQTGVMKDTLTGSVQVTASADAENAFRVDHIYFANNVSRGIGVRNQQHELTGVIDHNTFDSPTEADGGNSQSVAVMGANPQQSAGFARPYEPGSSKYIFFEDNLVTRPVPHDGVVEGYGGARFVVRFNAINGATQGTHGADSGNYRGTHSFEVYRNTFGPCDDCARTITMRSGAWMIFDNVIDSNHGDFHLRNLRSGGSYNGGVWGFCNGSNPVDGNDGPSGYPCLDQVGHIFTVATDGTNTLVGAYAWGNTKGGSLHAATPQTSDIQEERDFYDEDTTFDGKTGVGVGTLAARSATCVTGVGYWATDQGSWNTSGADGVLYKCTAPNTWTLYYTPYAYPHPLVVP